MQGVPFATLAEPVNARERYLFRIAQLAAHRRVEKAEADA